MLPIVIALIVGWVLGLGWGYVQVYVRVRRVLCDSYQAAKRLGVGDRWLDELEKMIDTELEQHAAH